VKHVIARSVMSKMFSFILTTIIRYIFMGVLYGNDCQLIALMLLIIKGPIFEDYDEITKNL